MEYRKLNFKRYEYLLLNDFLGNNNKEQIQFNDLEFKSLLSVIFAVRFHLQEYQAIHSEESKFFSETNNFFNITSRFGRFLIENLEGFKLECFQDLLKKTYNRDKVIINEDLIEFVEENLINQLVVREWEYGQYVLQETFHLIVDDKNWTRQSNILLKPSMIKEIFLNSIARDLKKTNTLITVQEAFLIYFVLKEKILPEKMSFYDYSIISQIAQQKMIVLNKRHMTLKESLSEAISLNFTLNRGKGGPKR